MKRKAKKKKPSATDDAVGPAREDGRVMMNPPTNADAGASTAAWKPTIAPAVHLPHQQHVGVASGAADGGSTRSSREGTITTTTTAAARSFSYGASGPQLRPPHFSTSATAPPDFLRGDHGYSSHGGVSGAVSSSGALPPSRRGPRLDSGQPDLRGGGASHMMTATMGLEDFQQMYFSSLQSTTPIARPARGGDNNPHQTVASHSSHAVGYFHDDTTRFHPHLSHEELARNVAFGGQQLGSTTPGTGGGDMSGRIVDHQPSWLHSSSYRQRDNSMPDASLRTSQQEQQSRIPSLQSHDYHHHSRPQGSASYARSGRAGDNNAILSSGSGDDWNHHGDPVGDAPPQGAASGALPLGAMSPLHFDQEDDEDDHDNGSMGPAE